jgi:FAD dependent oxidoreductase
MRVVVVGAGVIGAAVAFRLAQAGATVTVLESAERVGAGTSVRSFAWTNSNQKTPRAYHDLNVAGMTAHAALADEFGAIPWWHGGGSIDWCADDASRAEQAARVERLRSWGYAAKWISAAEVHELEPDLDLVQIGDAPIAFYPTEGWLDPIVYVHAMLTMARRHGASVRIGAHVEHVSVVRGRVQGVALRGGEHVGADVVVNCTGRWADTLGVVDTLDGGDAPGVVDSLDGGGAPGVVDSLDGGDALGVVDSLDGGDALGVVDSVNGGAAARAGGRALSLTLPLAPTLGLLVFTPPVASGLRRVVHAPSINMRLTAPAVCCCTPTTLTLA